VLDCLYHHKIKCERKDRTHSDTNFILVWFFRIYIQLILTNFVREFFHCPKKNYKIYKTLSNLTLRHKIVDKLVKKNSYARLHILEVTKSHTH